MIRWRDSSERPDTGGPITALIAIRDADEGDVFLLGIYLWRGEGWECEDTGRRLEDREYWWLPEGDLLAAIPSKVTA